MYLKDYRNGKRVKPLERMVVQGFDSGALSVKDGRGNEYFRSQAQREISFLVGGAPGFHTATLEDSSGKIIDQLIFQVDVQTQLDDQGGVYHELLDQLYLTMVNRTEASTIRYHGRLYFSFVPWLRDHVHVLKGMKYFAGRLQDGIDLYRDSQRSDGMIWDNVHERRPPFPGPDHWAVRFDYGGFFHLFDDCSAEFTRIPVENDVEYLFVEGLYSTWKATGDDAWLAGSIESAKKAMEYSLTSPYRWSQKFGLLKRGHTIDTWDFQCDEDCLSDFAGWPDPMAVHPDKTRFGIMFGDNTGYAAACEYLAEMLEQLDRGEEAAIYRQRGQQIRRRLDQVAWNGRFFTHHVPEDPAYTRDLGVDEASQLSLSNAYSLNRGISHAQCRAIIESYLDLKEHLPPGSPGEWYTIYPPFQKGYGGHNAIWQYMNASVSPIVAGELAHGAFQHGYESYGVDILRRLLDLGKAHGGVFHCSYTGAFPPPPPRSFQPLPLAPYAAAPLPEPWREVPAEARLPVGEVELAEIRFVLVDPAKSGGHGCIGLGREPGFVPQIEIPVEAKAASIYLLHAVSQMEPGGVVGAITLRYTDGSTFRQTVLNGKHVLPWSHWMYLEPERPHGSRVRARAAWRYAHPKYLHLQATAWGLDNPHPERAIASIRLEAAENGASWLVLGATLSDGEVFFQPDPISYGIPDGWGVAAVVYALIEGLAGVSDCAKVFQCVTLAPRWAAAGVDQAEVSVRYPASDGYLSYRYLHEPAVKVLALEVTGSGGACACHVLLPAGSVGVDSVRLAGESVHFTLSQVEQSLYVDFSIDPARPRQVEIQYM